MKLYVIMLERTGMLHVLTTDRAQAEWYATEARGFEVVELDAQPWPPASPDPKRA